MSTKILCADDDRGFCRTLARTFKEEGYEVLVAHDGASALELHQQHHPALSILSVMLPRRDGFAVLEAIRRDPELKDAPVFLLSGCALTNAYEERAERLRADAILRKPVPLERLVAMVRKQAGVGKAGDNAASGREPMLEGSLEEVPFPAVLHNLHGLRATGVIDLKRGKKRKQIQLRDGRAVVIRSNLVNETLGHLLAASGTISWDVMHESLQRSRRGEGLQGQILVAMHMLDEADLARALNQQAEEKLFETFSWETGSFRFFRGARVKSGNALSIKRGTAELILDGVRLRTPLPTVDAFLDQHRGAQLCLGESPFYLFQELELDADARAMLDTLQDGAPLESLGANAEHERRLLYGLLLLELIEVETAGPGRMPRERTAPPSPAAVHGPADVDDLRAELAQLAGRFQKATTPFEVLGVEVETDDETVRHAYTDLAQRTHPDRMAGAGEAVVRLAEEVFGRVAEAYDAVRDEPSRRRTVRDARRAERDAAELDEGHRALRAEIEFQKGEGALRARRYEEAARHFEMAVEAYPEEGEYRAWFGFAHWLRSPETPGRLEEAIRHVHAGRKLAPDRDKPYLFLGRLYKAADRIKQAEKMFTRAIQLAPDCVEAVRELRLIHMRREKSRGLVSRILRR